MAKRKLPRGMRLIGETYYAWVMVRGVRVRKALSTSFDNACELLAEEMSKLYGDKRGPADPLWDDVVKLWRAQHASGLRLETEYVRDLATFTAFAAPTRTSEITLGLVEDFRRHRQSCISRTGKPLSSRSVNREIAVLRSVLRWAVRRKLIAHDPLAALRPLGVEEDRRKVRRALRPEEFTRLLAACKPHLAALLRFLVGTGCRLEEASSLTWERVDLEGRTIRVEARIAKNKRSRVVPLSPSVAEMLRSMRPANGTGFVFPTTRGERFSSASSTLKAFYRAAAKAGIADARPNGAVDLHGLRVTFVTLALDAGADLKGVSEMVGHRQVSTTIGIYDRASEEGKRAAADAVDDLLAGKKLTKPKNSRRKS